MYFDFDAVKVRGDRGVGFAHADDEFDRSAVGADLLGNALGEGFDQFARLAGYDIGHQRVHLWIVDRRVNVVALRPA